jgi:hypothetical protein
MAEAVSSPADLGEELRLLRASVREFVAREIAPHMDEWERAGELPRALHEKAGVAGLLGVGYPEEVGGSGVSLNAGQAIGLPAPPTIRQFCFGNGMRNLAQRRGMQMPANPNGLAFP